MAFVNAAFKKPIMDMAVMERFILVRAAAKAESKSHNMLESATIAKEIYVPRKIVDLVVMS